MLICCICTMYQNLGVKHEQCCWFLSRICKPHLSRRTIGIRTCINYIFIETFCKVIFDESIDRSITLKMSLLALSFIATVKSGFLHALRVFTIQWLIYESGFELGWELGICFMFYLNIGNLDCLVYKKQCKYRWVMTLAIY